MLPESVTVPAVVLVRPPFPVSVDETVPDSNAYVPEDEIVPPVRDPLVSVTPPFSVCVVEAPERSTVPPLTVSALVLAPSLPDPETLRVAPLATVLLPV